MQECACCCWLLLLRHGWPPAAAASVTPSANEGAVTPLHCTLWQVTVAVTVRCQRPHAPTATTIAGRCCCRRNISQRSFHGASRRHSASLLITLRHAVCQVPACAQKRLAAAELVLQQQCQRCSSSAYGSGGGATGCCCCCSRCCDDGSSRLDVVRTL
jgi:hypothetical protein